MAQNPNFYVFKQIYATTDNNRKVMQILYWKACETCNSLLCSAGQNNRRALRTMKKDFLCRIAAEEITNLPNKQCFDVVNAFDFLKLLKINCKIRIE